MSKTRVEVRVSEGMRGGLATKTEVLSLFFDNRSEHIIASWPLEDFEAAGAEEFGPDVQAQRRYRGVVKTLREVAEKRAELEEAGKLTQAGILEALRPVADKALAWLEEAIRDMAGRRATAEAALRELVLPGDSPSWAPEFRAAFRTLGGERLATWSKLSAEEQAVLLAAPALVSGLPPEMHRAEREKALAALPSAGPLKHRVAVSQAVEAKAVEAAGIVRELAGMPDSTSTRGALPS